MHNDVHTWLTCARLTKTDYFDLRAAVTGKKSKGRFTISVLNRGELVVSLDNPHITQMLVSAKQRDFFLDMARKKVS